MSLKDRWSCPALSQQTRKKLLGNWKDFSVAKQILQAWRVSLMKGMVRPDKGLRVINTEGVPKTAPPHPFLLEMNPNASGDLTLNNSEIIIAL